MPEQKTGKITISLPQSLLELADRIARERSTTRSGLIADLLRREARAHIQELMAEGYREMGEENRREAEQALNLTTEVMLRNG